MNFAANFLGLDNAATPFSLKAMESMRAVTTPKRTALQQPDRIFLCLHAAAPTLLQKQTQIINHYGLDLTNPDAQNFLFDNIKGYLFDEGLPTAEKAEIDTTKEGTVKW